MLVSDIISRPFRVNLKSSPNSDTIFMLPFTSNKLSPEGIIPPIPTLPSFKIVNTSESLFDALKML